MDILKYKDYEGTAEVDMGQMTLRGKILFIDDLVTYKASSPAELQREFEEAVDDYLATCIELGRSPQKPLKGLFNVRVRPELHREAVLRGVKDDVSLNEVVVRALDAYLNMQVNVNHIVSVMIKPSTLQRIEASTTMETQWSITQHATH